MRSPGGAAGSLTGSPRTDLPTFGWPLDPRHLQYNPKLFWVIVDKRQPARGPDEPGVRERKRTVNATKASRLFHMLRYLRPAGGGLAAVSLATAGAYFVAVITADHPLPWWLYILLLGLAALGGIGYVTGQPDSEPLESATAPTPPGPTATALPPTEDTEADGYLITEPPDAPPAADAPEPALGPVITDKWHHTSDTSPGAADVTKAAEDDRLRAEFMERLYEEFPDESWTWVDSTPIGLRAGIDHGWELRQLVDFLERAGYLETDNTDYEGRVRLTEAGRREVTKIRSGTRPAATRSRQPDIAATDHSQLRAAFMERLYEEFPDESWTWVDSTPIGLRAGIDPGWELRQLVDFLEQAGYLETDNTDYEERVRVTEAGRREVMKHNKS